MVYTDLHYFGALSYYHALAQHDHIVFDITAAFSKMSFKNRKQLFLRPLENLLI